MDTDAELLDEEREAFVAYKNAKTRADETLAYGDALAAKRAWLRFLSIAHTIINTPTGGAE